MRCQFVYSWSLGVCFLSVFLKSWSELLYLVRFISMTAPLLVRLAALLLWTLSPPFDLNSARPPSFAVISHYALTPSAHLLRLNTLLPCCSQACQSCMFRLTTLCLSLLCSHMQVPLPVASTFEYHQR